jgi:hypothetical protein
LITRIIFGEPYRTLSSSFCSFFSHSSCHLVPLRPKYSSQHSVLIHLQPMSLPQCERCYLQLQNRSSQWCTFRRNV